MSNIRLDSYIGEYANVIIPAYAIDTDTEITSKITEIGSNCFSGKGIKVIYGSYIEKIHCSAFQGCSKLNKIIFPRCSYLDNFAFNNCVNIDAIDFPKCSFIGYNVFTGTTWLSDQFSVSKIVTFENEYQKFLIAGSIDFSGSIIDSTITFVCGKAFQDCINLTNIDFTNCTYIGQEAFSNCTNLTTLNIPNCTEFGESALYNCKGLTSISLPICSKIESNAFAGCSALSTINISTCKEIGDNAFINCTSLSYIAFPNCSQIGASAFYNTAWFANQLAVSSVIRYNNNYEHYLLYTSPSFISKFEDTTITYICGKALNNCTQISSASFINCHYIGESAFANCTSLTQIRFMSTSMVTLANSNAFDNCTSLQYIGVPASMVTQYQTTEPWKQYSNKIVPGEVYDIGAKPEDPAAVTYTGNEQTNGYNYDSDKVTITGDTKGTEVGTYTAYYTPKFGYIWLDGTQDTVAVTLTIKQAAGFITLDSTAAGNCDWNSTGTRIVTSSHGGTLSVTSSNPTTCIAAISNTSIIISGKNYNNGISSTITVTCAATKNYLATSISFTWTCNKTAGSCTAPTAKSLTYNGGTQTLINAGSSTTGTIYYKLNNGSYSTALPSATTANTYTISYYSKGSDNYYDSSVGSINVTIAKATLDTFTLKTSSIGYTTQPITVSVNTVKGNGVNATYSTSNTWTATAVGTYTATVTGTGNFQGSLNATWLIYQTYATVTLTPADDWWVDENEEELLGGGGATVLLVGEEYPWTGSYYGTDSPVTLPIGSILHPSSCWGTSGYSGRSTCIYLDGTVHRTVGMAESGDSYHTFILTQNIKITFSEDDTGYDSQGKFVVTAN